MNYFITSLLFISLSFNIYFFARKIDRKAQSEAVNKLFFWKKISHKEGYGFFKKKLKADFPENDLSKKTVFIYFWDSTDFDHYHLNQMMSLDSLATASREHNFNYIFATEMDENISKAFLIRNNLQFKNFKVMGGMDDFISGVYNEKP